MNRILFEAKAGSYTLDPRDSRFEHVRGVLRMREGDSFDVGVVNGPVGKASIVVLDRERMEVAVEWGEAPSLPPPVHLVVGLCRPATVRKILTVVPTLGVRQMSFVATERSDPAYARSRLWQSGEWRQYLVEGVEQAFDTHLPETGLHDGLQACLEALPAATSRRFAMDVYEGSCRLSGVEANPDEPVVLAVGPERGWSARDRTMLRASGFELVALNERVLRVETAVVSGLTLLLAAMGRL